MKNVYILYLRTPLIPWLEENKKVLKTMDQVNAILDNESYFTDYMLAYYDKQGQPEWSTGKIDRPLVKSLKH